MIRRLPHICMAALLGVFVASCGNTSDAPEAKTGSEVKVDEAIGTDLPIDLSKSKLNWLGKKITGSHPGGFENFSGTVSVKGDALTKVTIDIDTKSLKSDDEKLDQHLMSGDFFNVETYPTAKFEASSFTPLASPAEDGSTHTVTGNLTMLDKTQSITFPATISANANMVSAKAAFTIDRQLWGISYPGMPDDLINDEVEISFDIVAAPNAGGSDADASSADSAEAGGEGEMEKKEEMAEEGK